MLYNKSSNEISRENQERNDKYDFETNQGGEWDDDGSLDFLIAIEKSEMASQIIVRDLQGKFVEVIEEMEDFRNLIHRVDPDGKIGAVSMNCTMSYPKNWTEDEKVIALANRMKAAFVIIHTKDGDQGWVEDMKPTVR